MFSRESFDEDAFRIDNPLQDLDPDRLLRQADEFAKLVSQERPDCSWVRYLKNLARWTHLSNRPVVVPEQKDAEEPDEALTLLFRKAALVAQNPLKLDKLDLSKYEITLLQREHELRFWDQPKTLRVTVVTLCFSAIVQGWIQSCSNGANQNWPTDLRITTQEGLWNPEVPHAQWVFAGVNAITFLAASFFGCWLSDPLQSMVLGRRGAIFASSLLCFASLIGSACSHNWQQLLICRALVGLGMGAKASVTPIFGAETSPSHLRGAIVMNWQLFDAFGIFLGFTANLVFMNTGSNLSWRLQYASACIPTACLMTLIWTIPESPRWLLKQRRHRDAFRALCALRETNLQAAIELFYANAQLQIEAEMQPRAQHDAEKSMHGNSQHVENAEAHTNLNRFQDSAAMTNYFSRLFQLFRDPRTRRATVAASIVMISQQLCGINILQFYSSTFFRDIGGLGPSTDGQDQLTEGAVRALWLSWGVGLANFIFTFPAYYLIDRKGRRFLLFWTYPGMILSMLAACLSYANSSSPEPSLLRSQTLRVEIAVFLFIFTFFYSWGQGPIAFAYSSEVFPLINREAGMSFAVFINLLGAGILTLFVPLAQTNNNRTLSKDYSLNQARLLGVFVGFNVLAITLIFFFVPETAGATIRKREVQDHLSYMKLEELNYIFRVKTRNHVAYQVMHMIPYAGKVIRWWLCRWFTRTNLKPLKPKKMWIWVEMRDDAKQRDASEVALSSGSYSRGRWNKEGPGLQTSQRVVDQTTFE